MLISMHAGEYLCLDWDFRRLLEEHWECRGKVGPSYDARSALKQGPNTAQKHPFCRVTRQLGSANYHPLESSQRLYRVVYICATKMAPRETSQDRTDTPDTVEKGMATISTLRYVRRAISDHVFSSDNIQGEEYVIDFHMIG